jgi:hypothetical protein
MRELDRVNQLGTRVGDEVFHKAAPGSWSWVQPRFPGALLGAASASLAVDCEVLLHAGINCEVVSSILGYPSKFAGIPAVAFADCGDIAVL